MPSPENMYKSLLKVTIVSVEVNSVALNYGTEKDENDSVKKAVSIIVEIISSNIVPVILVILWWYLSSSGIFPSILMPPLTKIWSAFVKNFTNGLLAKDLISSLSIVLKGYIIGSLLGLIAGILMGIFPRVKRMFDPVLNGLRQIPPLAWIPLLILWFGIGNASKVILIIMGSFFPVLLNTVNGIAGVPQGLLEFAKLYKIKKRDILLHIYLPGALSSIFVGLRLGASTAWMSIVAAEMIAATAGVGYRINDARNLMQSDLVIVYMILIACVGGLMDFAIKSLAKYVLKWQRA